MGKAQREGRARAQIDYVLTRIGYREREGRPKALADNQLPPSQRPPKNPRGGKPRRLSRKLRRLIHRYGRR
jgi:hypothetical protein